MLYVELLLERTNGGFESGLSPENIPRECSGPGGIGPVFVHPGVAGNVPLLPCEVLVLRVVRVPPLTKRLGDCLTIGLDKYGIPLFLGVMRSFNRFQA